MKRLFHLSTTRKQLGLFDEDWQEIEAFVQKQNIDGIELGLTLDYEIERVPKQLITGVHLTFYPMWLDFWYGKKERLNELFASEEAILQYYKASTPEELVANYRKQYVRAKALGAEYMVFHVSHILPEHSFFTKPFDYSDKEVMEATIELVNAAFPSDEEGPLLLFENLWWPGLNYKDPKLTKWFIEQIEYSNKGYLVDISHLILNQLDIGNEKQAYGYIKKTITSLGETAKWIKGVHLNKAFPKRYCQRDFSLIETQYHRAKDSKQKQAVLMKHINALDGHEPFDHPIAKEILKVITPQYCVYETAPTTRYELAYFIKKQNEALGY